MTDNARSRVIYRIGEFDMITILNGIVLILAGLAGTLYMPAVCDRHGEPGLAVGGVVMAAVGAVNVFHGVQELRRPELLPDVVTFYDTLYADSSFTAEDRAALVRGRESLNEMRKLAGLASPLDTADYIIWYRHDMGYETDIVKSDYIRERPDGKWHLHGLNGTDYISDRKPIKVEEK